MKVVIIHFSCEDGTIHVICMEIRSNNPLFQHKNSLKRVKFDIRTTGRLGLTCFNTS